MDNFIKLINWLIFVLVEIGVGWLISKLTFCVFGQVLMVAYTMTAFALAAIFAIGLCDGDF